MDGKKRSSLGAASFWRGAGACCVILLSVLIFVFGFSSNKTAWAAPEDDDGVSIELFDYSALDSGERLPQQRGGNKKVNSVNSATEFRKSGTKYAAFHFQYNQIDDNSDYGCTYKMNGGSFIAPWQTWASGKGPTQGVVKDTLGTDGMPVFGTLVSNQNESMSDKSLSYLFTDSDYAVAYTNVNAVDDEGTNNGLLYKEQTDNGSHYYFDSKDTFAEFDISTGIFKKYDNPNGNSPASEPRFLPFDELNEITLDGQNDEGGYLDKDKVNYSFGMKMTVDFLQPAGGKVGNENMRFEFNGDDDVWVFIDDVLVLDIGGIHDAKGGWIDFATGQVHVDGDSAPAGSSSHDTTLKKLFTDAGVNNLDDLFNEDDTFKDYTTHKLSFFYLERGAGGSNCQIDFNLQTIPEGTINIGKNVDYANLNNVSDLDFTFKAYVDSDGDATNRDDCRLFTGKYDIYELGSNRLIEANVQTSADGTITLKHGQYAQISDGVAENSKYYVIETGVTSDTYEVTLAGTSQKLETVTGDGETVIGVQTPLLTVSDMAFVTFNNTVQVENAFNVEIKKEGSVVDGDTFYVLTMIGSKKYTGEYTVYDSDDAVNGTEQTTDNGIIKLQAGQHAEIVGIVGGNTVSVYEVNEDGTPFSDDMYREPTFSMEGKADGGTVLHGAPTALNDDNGKGIKGETNEGKALGKNPTLLAKITNKLVAEPVQPELHKYVDDNEDGTYDLSLDVHGAIGASQADPTEVDIVYILDLSYSMMWEMDGTYPGGEYNDGGDDEEWAEEYSFVRYNAAVNAINTLNSELAANEGLDVRAALVTFAPETLKETGFVSASSFSSMLPAAQWSTFASGTNYGAALNSAKSVLEGAREDARKVVIFISDGEPNRDGLTANEKGDADESTQFAENQVRDLVCDSFYTIGVGRDTYEQYLKRVVNAAASAKYKQYFASSDSDALAEYFESIASAITAVDCTNVVITDKLSEFAELTDDATFNVTITKDDHGGESVAVNGGPVSIDAAKAGKTLTFQSENGETQTLTLKYDADTKTFTLTFPSDYALEAGWTYTITTQIQPTEEARNYYQKNGKSPDRGDLETDVPGTPDSELISSGKPGFHSNDEATLSYTSAKQNKVDEYPNPVIQANQLTIKDVLKVTKTVRGHTLDEGMFDFTVEPKAWDNGETGDERVEVTALQAADKAGLTVKDGVYEYTNSGTAEVSAEGLARMGNQITFTTADVGKTYVYVYDELEQLDADYLSDLTGDDVITSGDVVFDPKQYKVELAVSEGANGELEVTMTKYERGAVDDDWSLAGESVTISSDNCDCSGKAPLMTVDFVNEVPTRTITAPLGIRKTLEGAELTTDMFRFNITAQDTQSVSAEEAAATAGSVGEDGAPFTSWTVTSGDGNVLIMNSMRFTAADAGKVFEYVIAEDGGYIAEEHDRDDYVYDETQYLLQFRPVLVEESGHTVLEVELWQATREGGDDSFPEPVKVGTYWNGPFKRVESGAQTRAITQAEYELEFTNTVSKANLSISKVLENNEFVEFAPKDVEFTIQIVLKDKDDKPITGQVSATGVEGQQSVTFNDSGIATVTLKAGETITITGLPVGAKYTITEPEESIPGGFKLVGVSGSGSDKPTTREALVDHVDGDIDPTNNDVTVTNMFVGYGLGIFKGELAYNENGDIALDDDGLPYADPEHPLSGAVFEISAPNDKDEKQAFGRLETDEDGKAVFMSLPNNEGKTYQTFLKPGTYYINEVKVPSGYQLLGYEITLTIGNDGKASISIPQGEGERPLIKELDYDNDGNLLIEVANKPNPDLPSSGSNGTLLMMSTGFAAIVLAGTYLSKRFGHLWS